MSARELIVLGTASMAPTRYRAHNGYALRWDDQLILFDPGEGTQRGCTVTGVSIAKATAVCITHFHGDHCLGLPGVIQRRSHENDATERPGGLGPLPVFHPADGEIYFDRLHHSTLFEDNSDVQSRGVSVPGHQAMLGSFELRAEPLFTATRHSGIDCRRPMDSRSIRIDLLKSALRAPTSDCWSTRDGSTLRMGVSPGRM